MKTLSELPGQHQHCREVVLSAADATSLRASMPLQVKHMAFRFLFLQQVVRNRGITPKKVRTIDNRAGYVFEHSRHQRMIQ